MARAPQEEDSAVVVDVLEGVTLLGGRCSGGALEAEVSEAQEAIQGGPQRVLLHEVTFTLLKVCARERVRLHASCGREVLAAGCRSDGDTDANCVIYFDRYTREKS